MQRRLLAALAAVTLGAGFAGACGGSDENSNEGELVPEGGEVQTETSPGVTAAPTQTEPQETVTQTDTDGP
jgi:hypothetical protein